MIRCFASSDLYRILEIEHQSFPKSPYHSITFINLYHLYSETFWVYADTTPDQKEGQIWGYIIFSKDGHIISIAIHPHRRRRDIGKELLERAMDYLQPKKVWAEVRKSNQGAQAFYLHMGFQIIETVPNYYENEDALIVQWIPSGPKSH